MLSVAGVYSFTTVAPPFSSGQSIITGRREMLHYQCASMGMSPQTPDLKLCEIQRYLPGRIRLNQHCVNSFGEGLHVTDIHLYVRVTHSRFIVTLINGFVLTMDHTVKGA